MALYVSISINKDAIETFGAQNITGKTSGINTYRICKYTQNNHKRVFLSGTIQHRYEDGAIELAKKVLDFVTTIDGGCLGPKQ